MPVNEDSIKKYQAHENQTPEDFLKRYSSTESELKETITYLIRHRELLKNAELEKLEAESEQLIQKLKNTKRKKLLEEIECFKEILALHKRLIEKNANQRD